MQKPRPRPPALSDFKGKPLGVTVTRKPKDEADIVTTQSLIQHYTQDDGFHCPVCNAIITDPEKAVYHLGIEMNKALSRLGR